MGLSEVSTMILAKKPGKNYNKHFELVNVCTVV